MESTAARKPAHPPGPGASKTTRCCAGRAASATTSSRTGALAAYFVRSPHAFAKIERIDVAAAKNARRAWWRC